MKFSGKIIISDIDGTYTGSDCGMDKNNEAIEYFKANGGLFTFASGRVENSILNIVPKFFELINAPAVMCNGSYLYDKEKDERINEMCVDSNTAMPLLKLLKKEIPEIGIRINRRYGFMTPELTEIAKIDAKQYSPEEIPFDEMPTDNWNKIVLLGDITTIERAHKVVEEYGLDKFAVSYSCKTLLELLAPGATKGNQVLYLKKLLGDVTTYCCGDYENDEDMLKKADFAVVPCSGMEKIIKIADMVACHCKDGAIADLIETLDKNTD